MVNPLTIGYPLATIDLPLPPVAVGFSRPFYLGDNSPLNTVVFLCASFRAASGRAFRYGVVIGAAFGLTVPRCGTANPDNHAAQCLAALGGVCSPFNLGLPMPQNNSAQYSINPIPYFFVAVNGQRVSCFFRTGDEANAFLGAGDFVGAYCIEGAYYPRSVDDARHYEARLFNQQA